jgi:hypothetical protein
MITNEDRKILGLTGLALLLSLVAYNSQTSPGENILQDVTPIFTAWTINPGTNEDLVKESGVSPLSIIGTATGSSTILYDTGSAKRRVCSVNSDEDMFGLQVSVDNTTYYYVTDVQHYEQTFTNFFRYLKYVSQGAHAVTVLNFVCYDLQASGGDAYTNITYNNSYVNITGSNITADTCHTELGEMSSYNGTGFECVYPIDDDSGYATIAQNDLKVNKSGDIWTGVMSSEELDSDGRLNTLDISINPLSISAQNNTEAGKIEIYVNEIAFLIEDGIINSVRILPDRTVFEKPIEVSNINIDSINTVTSPVYQRFDPEFYSIVTDPFGTDYSQIYQSPWEYYFSMNGEARISIDGGIHMYDDVSFSEHNISDINNITSGNISTNYISTKGITLTSNETIAASGGTISTVGNYIVHTFTANGTFTPVLSISNVEVLIVAGGGGSSIDGGSGYPGGGAGGVLSLSSGTLSSQNYAVVVGAGGAIGTNGSNSSFNASMVIGGGYGGTIAASGGNGGSGGGGYPAGTGTSGQGNNGGLTNANGWGGSGGGGKNAVGAPGCQGNGCAGGAGGIGISSNITGTPTYYGGGGGGSSYNGAQGTGGLGGGGNGRVKGTNTTGGGAGGGGYTGGSGIIVIKYPVTPAIWCTKVHINGTLYTEAGGCQ